MIDAHQHIWQIGRNGCTWPGVADGVIFRDFGMEDFRAAALPLGVTGTVLVQSQEDDADTDWLLDVADADSLVARVVGWVDLASEDAVARVRALARRPKLAGLRPMVQQREADWYDNPSLGPAFGAMLDAGLRLDALIRVQHLASLDRLAGRWPGLPIVIDHAAKPRIDAQDGFHHWHEAIAPLADRANVACKLSGLLTECGMALAEAIGPYVEALLRLFGPERLMWGSDWPVVNGVSAYGDWLALARALVPGEHHGAVFAGTAREFYGMEAATGADAARAH